MTETKRATRLERIAQHGRNLLAIFPNATEQDPVKLCKKLRRLEIEGNELGLRLCNGPEFPGGYDEADAVGNAILAKVNRLLGIGKVGVMLNRDPRGYALKIGDVIMRKQNLTLHTDMGGYGILAPEID
jgi:hypothetical protein